MNAMSIWWNGLEPLNQWFFIGAIFFSTFFIWQLVMALLGLGGGDADIDTHVEMGAHEAVHDAADTVSTFKLISVRSLLAFFTLFTWAGALYMYQKVSVSQSLLYASLWGAVAMVAVSGIFHLLNKMTETGNVNIHTAVGANGTVYLDIPAGGDGEIRVLCSGIMTHLKARTADGSAIKAGTAVKVAKVISPNAVEVIPEVKQESQLA